MNRFIMAVTFAALTSVAVTSPVQAKHRYHASHLQKHHYRVAKPLAAHPGVNFDVAAIAPYPTVSGHVAPSAAPMGRRIIAPSNGYSMAEGVIGGRPSGCPHAYCGCSASLRVFGKIIPELNLAANWRRFPQASPASGMAAWRWGHVFIIESVNSDGTVIAHDGNSGQGLTRLHTVSLRGYHVVNPNGETSFSARKVRYAQH